VRRFNTRISSPQALRFHLKYSAIVRRNCLLYHPALWFYRLKSDKNASDENCMQVNGNRLLLVKTLTSIQENTRLLPLAFGRKKMICFNVQHILGVSQNVHESLWLLSGLMIVFMAFLKKEGRRSVGNQSIVAGVVNQ
jgi:hypothetical protein